MPCAYNPADDLERITAAMFAHLARCDQSSFDSRKIAENGFGFPQDTPALWIKFNPDGPTTLKESRMHSYVHDHVQPLSGCQIPRIHRVYVNVFCISLSTFIQEVIALTAMQQLPDKTNGQLIVTRLEDAPWGITAMDYVKSVRLKDLSIHKQDPSFQEILASRIATVLINMSSLRPPPGTAPGPGDGSRMSSLVWGYDDFDGPQGFDTVQELQDHINEFIEDIPFEETADFSGEPLCLCYGNFNEGNFMLEDSADPHSTLTMIDFQRANWLPISFLLWEVTNRDFHDGAFYRILATAVRKILPLPPNMDNLQALHSLRWKRGRPGHWITTHQRRHSVF